MFSKFKVISSLLVLFIVCSPLMTLEANAYTHWTNKARFTSGTVYGKQYYVYQDNFTYNGKTRNYGNLIDQAVTNWNTYVNGTTTEDVLFTQTSSASYAETEFYVNNYGSTGWNGVAEFFNSSGNQIGKTGDGPTYNYLYGRAKLNAYTLHDDIDNDIRATAGHEFGHTLGLAHSGSLNALMYKNRDRNVYSPATDDRAGIQSLY
jgi:predicted Zn-dependent protease